MLQNPITGRAMVTPFATKCLDAIESLAEKFRAALTRREVAIRDFYDIDYLLGKMPMDLGSPEFLTLVRQKLAVSGNDPIHVGPERLAELRTQMTGRLMPVLRERDFAAFDVEKAFRTVVDLATQLC